MDPVTAAIVAALAAGAARGASSVGKDAVDAMVQSSNALATLLREKYGERSEEVTDRLNRAKKEYEEAVRDRTTPLERHRSKLLAELTELQTEVMLTVSSPALLLRLLPMLFEQTIELYEARTSQDLMFVELGGFCKSPNKVHFSRFLSRATRCLQVLIGAVIG